MAEVHQTAPKKRRRSVRVLQRAVLIIVIALVTWIVIELLLRWTFDRLPAGIQGAIQSVQRWPWSEETIIPRTPFIIDDKFQARLDPGLKDFPVHWSDAQFTFNTISLWTNPDGTVPRFGLRTNPPQWPVDIMTFGDSFTFCWVKFEDCWVQRLNADYGWHVVNAGNPGTGPTGQLNLMREAAPPIKPALVIWQWFPNDETDDYDLARIQNKVEALEGSPYPDPDLPPQGLARYSALAAIIKTRFDPPVKKSPYKHFQDLVLNGRVMSIRTNEYANPYALDYAQNRYGLEQNLAAHVAGATFVRDTLGAKLLIVFIPTKEEAYGDMLTPVLGKEYLDKAGEGRRKLLAQCEANGWYCIDALPALKEAVNSGKTVYYAYDSHLDPVGNQILEGIIAKYIQDKGLIPARGK